MLNHAALIVILTTGLVVVPACGQEGSGDIPFPRSSANNVINWQFLKSEGIRVELASVDTSLISQGLAARDIVDGARVALEATGWRYDEGSPNVLSVVIRTMSRSEETVRWVRIEVTSGRSRDAMQAEMDGDMSIHERQSTRVSGTEMSGIVPIVAQTTVLAGRKLMRARFDRSARSAMSNEYASPIVEVH